ncbi:MAG: GNAT family N-acetyltransferase [Candidatus Thiodiazotropha sp.]
MADKPTYAAFRERAVSLSFGLSASKKLSLSIRALELLGSDLLGDDDVGRINEIVDNVWKEFPDVEAIYLKSVLTDSMLWRYFETHDWKLGEAPVYLPDSIRSFHYIELPKTHDEYLSGFRSKQRYTLKKKVRKLLEAFPGRVDIFELSDANELPRLTENATRVINNSWKAQNLKQPLPSSIRDMNYLSNIAKKGLLKAHVLTIDGEPCAFIIGYLYKGIYHYADLAYDLRFGDYSPGIVLLYRVIESMIEQEKASFVNFGITDAQYKQVFGNRHLQDAGIMVLRPTLTNKFKIGLHRMFRDAKAHLKQRRDNAREFKRAVVLDA